MKCFVCFYVSRQLRHTDEEDGGGDCGTVARLTLKEVLPWSKMSRNTEGKSRLMFSCRLRTIYGSLDWG